MSSVSGNATGTVGGVGMEEGGWFAAVKNHRLLSPLRGDGLRATALRGSAWTFLGYGASNVLRLASSLILTRLLMPEAFGLMALVNVFMSGLQMFSDVGIGPAIIQSKREDPTFLNTAWTMQIVRGFALATLSALLAWPLALLYGQDQLTFLLPVVGLSALIASFQTTALFTVNRKLDVKRLVILQFLSQLASVVVLVTWAYFHRSVWALAGSGVISGLITLGLGYWMLPAGHAHRFCWDAPTRRELMRFGKWIFASTVLTFLAGQADRLLMGKLVDVERLGVYSIALMLAALPTQLILKVSGTVVFPTFSRLAREGEGALARQFQRVRLPLLIGGGALAAGIAAAAPWLVPALYRPAYHDAAWMLQILAVAAVFQFMEQTLGSALLALGRSKDIAAGNFVKLACLITLVPLGWHFRGMLGILLGIGIGDALKYLTLALLARREGLRPLGPDVLLLGALCGLGLAAFATTWGLAHLAPGAPRLALAVTAITIAMIGPGLWLIARRKSRHSL